MYTKKTDRMDIILDDAKKQILIQQKWKYNWINQARIPLWTDAEKKAFHVAADNLIWKKWGAYFKVKVRGLSSFSKTHAKSQFVVNFDLKKVETTPHWDVTVKKIPKGGFDRSYMIWQTREIHLDSEDTKIRPTGPGTKQTPVVHEFGHAIGNVPVDSITHSDEYDPSSAFFADKFSVMNSGTVLRNRHLDYIITQLNTMIKDCEFYL